MSVSPAILHLIDGVGIGGAQHRLLNDLKYLDGEFSHQVYTLFPDKENNEDEFRQLDIPVTCLGLRSPSYVPLGVSRLLHVLWQKRNIRLIHTQLFFADTVGRLAGRLCGRPVISTVQSAIYEPDSGLNSRWRWWVDRLTAGWSQRFIAVSVFVKQSLHTRLGISLDRIDVIPNSVDLRVVKSDEIRRRSVRKQLRLDDRDFMWITVGRLNPAKGYQYLLEGMAQVLSRFPTTRLLIIGDGPQRSSLEEIRRSLGLSEFVQFLGERRDVIALLDAADAFVFPSLSEGLPVSLLEAMALAKPCVVSRIGPHEELVEHSCSGLLVMPRNPEALASTMCRIQSDRIWGLELGKQARERVVRYFDAASCARELRQLYERLITAR